MRSSDEEDDTGLVSVARGTADDEMEGARRTSGEEGWCGEVLGARRPWS